MAKLPSVFYYQFGSVALIVLVMVVVGRFVPAFETAGGASQSANARPPDLR